MRDALFKKNEDEKLHILCTIETDGAESSSSRFGRLTPNKGESCTELIEPRFAIERLRT